VSKLNIIDQGSGSYIIDGDLTFASIDKQTLKSFAFLTSAKEISIDLSKVNNSPLLPPVGVWAVSQSQCG